MLKYSENPPVLIPRAHGLTDVAGHWWVAHTRPRFEKALAFDLLRRDIGYFLPMIERTSISGGRKRKTLIPLFTSYVFLCGAEVDRYEALRTGRVAQVIDVADQQQLIGELSALERVLRVSGNQLDLHAHIACGQRCRIRSGPFASIEGVVVRQSQPARIVLQVTMLGQGASMEVDAELLEPIEHAPSPPTGRLSQPIAV